jgi:hypothetical protein
MVGSLGFTVLAMIPPGASAKKSLILVRELTTNTLVQTFA